MYCVEGVDRLCHDEILFIGTKKECDKLTNPWFQHNKYGGIDAVTIKYNKRAKGLKHNIHTKTYNHAKIYNTI